RPTALLERRPEAKGPESFHRLPLLRDGVIQPGERDAKQVRPDRHAERLQRCAYPDRIVSRGAAPLERTLIVPRHADIVEDGALERREGGGDELVRRIEDRETDLGAPDADLGPDQAIELSASGLGLRVVGVEALVPAVGARRISPNQIGAAGEYSELPGIAADPA